jgi:hypothetical protein
MHETANRSRGVGGHGPVASPYLPTRSRQGRVGSVTPRLVRTDTAMTEAANDLGKHIHGLCVLCLGLDPLTAQLNSASDLKDPHTPNGPTKKRSPDGHPG